MAWDEVTSARALDWLPGNEASSPFYSSPHPHPHPLCPESSSTAPPPCRLFSLSLTLALASCRWETLAWSFARGRGHGCVVTERLHFCWAQRTLGRFSLDWHRRAIPANLLPFEKASQVSLYFPTCCTAKCPIALCSLCVEVRVMAR